MRFFRKVEIWAPTLSGWVAACVLVMVLAVVFLKGVHPFLAIHDPIGGDVLVVESWLSEADLVNAVETFRAGRYRKLATVGAPMLEGSYLKWRYPDLHSRAEVIRAQLIASGLDSSRVVAINRSAVRKDRTYASAVALRNELNPFLEGVDAVDVLSIGAHARRSRLLYQMGLGDVFRVGVIAQQDRHYD